MDISYRIAGFAAAIALLAGCSSGQGGTPAPPRATSSTLTLDEDTDAQGTMTGVPGESGALTFSVQSQPMNGSLAVSGTDFTYTPNPDFFGTDAFTFIVSENGRNSSPATITLFVAGIDDPPAASDSAESTAEDVGLQADVTASDVDGDTMTLTIQTPPANGTVTPRAGTSYSYTPAPNFFGRDSFVYTISDGTTETQPATVTIDVIAVNDAPVVTSTAVNVQAGSTLTIDIRGTDVENDTLTYRLTDTFDQAVLTNDPTNVGMLELDVAYGAWGPDQATIVANDGAVDSAPATIDLAIQVPTTTPNITYDIYDGEHPSFTRNVIEGPDGTVYVVGLSTGLLQNPSPDSTRRRFVAIHDESGLRTRVVYFDDFWFGDIASVASGFNNGLFTALGIDVDSSLTVRTITLDENNDPDIDASATVPYAITRAFRSLTPVHIPGRGYYVIGNDNRVSWLNYSGALQSTVAIPSPIWDRVHRYRILDARVINDEVFVAGGYTTCTDDGSDCSIEGLGRRGFVLRLDLFGNPLGMIELLSFPQDMVILSDGRVVTLINALLNLLDTDGSILWQRTSASTPGLIGIDSSDDIFWWGYRDGDFTGVATRVSVDNTLIWQTKSPFPRLGTLSANEMNVDPYGNMFVSLIEQYAVSPQLLGRLFNVHVDYSGIHQWTEISEPSDLSANRVTGTASAKPGTSILSSNYRLITIATDNIGNVDQPDGFVFFNAIAPPPP